MASVTVRLSIFFDRSRGATCTGDPLGTLLRRLGPLVDLASLALKKSAPPTKFATQAYDRRRRLNGLFWQGVLLGSALRRTSCGISAISKNVFDEREQSSGSDRSQPAYTIRSNAVERPRRIETASGSRLPVGCESLVSAFVHSQLARIARRCVS